MQVAPVQVRPRLIYKQDDSPAQSLGNDFDLTQSESGDHQLFLTP
jgi:hypothetical protein